MYSAAVRVNIDWKVVILSSTESKIAKSLLTNSAKDGEGIVKFPRGSILNCLLLKLPVVAIKEDQRLLLLRLYVGEQGSFRNTRFIFFNKFGKFIQSSTSGGRN